MSIQRDEIPGKTYRSGNILTRVLTKTEMREIQAYPGQTFLLINDAHESGSWTAREAASMGQVCRHSGTWRIETRKADDPSRRDIWISYDPEYWQTTGRRK